MCAPALTPTLSLLNQVISKAVVLASPVVAALLLSEAVLGLLSRFAPQMNAFAVSLTVKSAVALLIMLMYFGPVLPDTVARLVVPAAALPGWARRCAEMSNKTEQPTRKRLQDAARKASPSRAATWWWPA